jgi:chromosome segregation ATPase
LLTPSLLACLQLRAASEGITHTALQAELDRAQQSVGSLSTDLAAETERRSKLGSELQTCQRELRQSNIQVARLEVETAAAVREADTSRSFLASAKVDLSILTNKCERKGEDILNLEADVKHLERMCNHMEDDKERLELELQALQAPRVVACDPSTSSC